MLTENELTKIERMTAKERAQRIARGRAELTEQQYQARYASHRTDRDFAAANVRRLTEQIAALRAVSKDV